MIDGEKRYALTPGQIAFFRALKQVFLTVALGAGAVTSVARGAGPGWPWSRSQAPSPQSAGPRYVAYDHNNVIHLFDRLGELKPPGEGDEHPHIPQHYEKGIHAALSAHAEFIAFSARRPEGQQHYDVFVWERRTRQVLGLPGASSGFDDDYPSISADGNLVAYHTLDPAAAESAGIRLYDRKAAKLLALPGLAARTGIPYLSPAGNLIVFSAPRSPRVGSRETADGTRQPTGDRDIYLYDRQARRLVDLPGLNSPADDESPRISGDGRTIAFCSRRDGGKGAADVYLYDRNLRRIITLPDCNTQADEPECDLSADGRFLAFLTDRRGMSQIRVRPMELLLYDLKAGKEVDLPRLPHQGRVHFSPALSRE